ncbi:MAG: PBP1A family penicillin-binding protein [Nitrospirae bacterium]|nr:MAG: PBP1A family penicillin-binding protein [Nitrospirota bacterium]
MTFAERFLQLLHHLLRNLLQRRQSVWKALLWGAVTVVVIGFVAGLVTVGYLLQDLPPITGLHEYQPSLVTRVYSADKQVIGQFFVERRILVPLDKIPRQLVNALVAIEDSRFFEHRGLDFVGIARAAITNLASGKIRQGASTITQQLARSLFLSPKRDFERKAKEALLALKMEQILGKEQILELYLNQIYFGHGAYGVQSAAHTYFGKDVGEITLAEAAYLAGLPKGPADYSPYYHPDASKKRQATVLRRMVEERFITPAEADAAMAGEVQFKRLTRDEPAPYFVEHIRQRLMATYGEAMVYKGGLQVYTTLSFPEQQTATTILEQGLRELDKRQGYRGPLRRSASPGEFSAKRVNSGASADAASRPGGIIEAVVTRVEKDGLTVLARGLTGQIATDDLIWARRRLKGPDPIKHVKDTGAKTPDELFNIGDVIEVRVKKMVGNVAQMTLEQTPLVEGALLSLDPRTGAVRVMIGGYDFQRSEYNRATSARRQPGSAFKPMIYAAAVNQGLSPGTPIVDSGVVYNENDADLVWRPENYDQQFYGLSTLRESLVHSRNAATVRLLEKISIPPVLDLARNLGITSPLANDLTLALGSSGVTLQELTAAYGTFFNQGIRLEPYTIESVLDANDKVLETHVPDPRAVMTKESAYLITNMMEDVIQRGTAQAAKDMGRPLAGKTGTTNDFTDAWFVGGAPNLVTGVWVGFDEIRTLGDRETGSRAALPIWMNYMTLALESLPVVPFTMPDGIVEVTIDPATGLLAPEGLDQAIVEVYLKGTEPTKQAEMKSSPSQFFKFDQM